MFQTLVFQRGDFAKQVAIVEASAMPEVLANYLSDSFRHAVRTAFLAKVDKDASYVASDFERGIIQQDANWHICPTVSRV